MFGGAFATQIEGYKPSRDNSAELNAGWITKANSIRELVKKLGREPDPLFGKIPLEKTIQRWNKLLQKEKIRISEGQKI